MLPDVPSLPPPAAKPSLKGTTSIAPPSLRRSPRKHTQNTTSTVFNDAVIDAPELVASSLQRRASPRKQASPVRSPLKSIQPRSRTSKLNIFDDIPDLSNAANEAIPPRSGKHIRSDQVPVLHPDAMDELLGSMRSVSLNQEKLEIQEVLYDSDIEVVSPTKVRVAAQRGQQASKTTSTMSKITQAAKGTKGRRAGKGAAGAQYVLKEAHCEDLNESSGSEGEDEDTDLSGFIVDDDEDLTIYEDEDTPEENESSEDEAYQRRSRRRDAKTEDDVEEKKATRKLRRGHRRQPSESDVGEGVSDSEVLSLDDGLSRALSAMKIGEGKLRQQRDKERRTTLEVIDLTTSPVAEDKLVGKDADESTQQFDVVHKLPDPFSENVDLVHQLHPTVLNSHTTLLPSKTGPTQLSQSQSFLDGKLRSEQETTAQPTTPPATPPQPRSPSKLKSPSKLHLSPSKRGGSAMSPHRQSMDAFWDHSVINRFNDDANPKTAPIASPRRNPLSRFELWADDGAAGLDLEDQLSYSEIDESEDSSLPSPCESPTKKTTSGRIASPSKSEKEEKRRMLEEKRARIAEKKKFDARKERMANELLQALDDNVTGSRIAKMSASTGGVQIVWSKTLRSTAGRANWKRTVTKPSGSPIKGNPASKEVEKQAGVVVQHFANIELAEKVIDREDRLINTLSHEFCHLANFMVSGIRDQPHGASFQQWGAKVTAWMKLQNSHPEWKNVEVTTKHGYVIEHKYLWVCVGRPQDFTMKMLSIDEEEGCGAEYGRHSKSIDAETQRCGRCKGRLVQVRPVPRATPASPRKNNLRSPRKAKDGVNLLEKMIEVVDLSD